MKPAAAGHVLHRVSLIVLMHIYIFSLYYIYKTTISPLFGKGYPFFQPDLWIWIKISLFSTLPALILPTVAVRPSHVINWILYVVAYIPIILMPHIMSNHATQYTLFAFIVCGSFFTVLFLMKIAPLLQIPTINIPSRGFFTVGLLMCLFFAGIVALTFGLPRLSLSLTNVYDVRADYYSRLSSSGTYVAYIVGWLVNAVGPFLIVVSLSNRNIFGCAVGIICQLYIFLVTGYKSALFTPILMSGIFVLSLKNGRYFAFGLLSVVAGSLPLAAIVDAANNTIILESLYARRVLMMPGIVTTFYFDYFEHMPPLFLSNGILSSLIDYPLTREYARLISSVYFGHHDGSANVNFWMDSFVHFGYIGIPLFTTIYSLVLWIGDSVTREIPVKWVGPLLVVPFFALNNSALLTSLLSHGIGLSIIFTWLFASYYRQKQKDYEP